MSLVKSKGNMYDWVTHQHAHIIGKCTHGCKYCYVQAIEKKFPTGRYSGDIRLNENEFNVAYGNGKVIFIEHMNDLFAKGVPDAWIIRILEHCKKYPDNEYVFQTKNPDNLLKFINNMPVNYMVGTTVESDVVVDLYDNNESCPPSSNNRLSAMAKIPVGVKKFITIEPMVKLGNAKDFAGAIASCYPDFVNIGVDSKMSNIQDPTKEQILDFVAELQKLGVTIRKKTNLSRILDV